MRVPTRKSEILAQAKKGLQDFYLTKEKIERLKRELVELERARPEAIAEVRRTQEMGDLSENAAYQEAKWALRRMNARIVTIQERLKNAIVIEKSNDGTVQIGSTVEVEMNGAKRSFEIVGEQEADPTRGRISFKSPIGRVLMGKTVGETVDYEIQARKQVLKIVTVS